MKSGSLKNVIPPIAAYAETGQPYKTSLSNLQNNIQEQNRLNTTHGGSKSPSHIKKRNGERKNTKVFYRGGAPPSPSPASVKRPTEMIIPQAPSFGASAPGPHTGNSVAAGASQAMMNHFVNSQYDSKVVLPPVPRSQNGGKPLSLLKRLERMTRSKRAKTRKSNQGKNKKKGTRRGSRGSRRSRR